MSRVTYWVEYTFKYKFWDEGENDWCDEESVDAERFHCPKKDIKSEVRKAVLADLEFEKIKDLKIDIIDYYITSDCEL